MHIFVKDIRSNKIKKIRAEHTGKFFAVGKNSIWIKDAKGTLRRFGPDLSLKKLNAKQLLLFISAKHSDKHPEEIISDTWKSIDNELQKKLSDILGLKRSIPEFSAKSKNDKTSIFTRLKSYLCNPVTLGSIGIISLASYFLYLKYLSHRVA